MVPLKEKVEAENKAKYNDRVEAVYAYSYNLIVKTIEDSWVGEKLKVCVEHSIYGGSGKVCPVDEYINIVDRVCVMLNEAEYLEGFKFQREGSGQDADGCWGEPMFISITNAVVDVRCVVPWSDTEE